LRKTKELRLAIFEKKVLKKIYGSNFDRQTNEWEILHNYELQMQFQRPDIIKKIIKRRLMWVNYAWHKQKSLVRQNRRRHYWEKTFREIKVKRGGGEEGGSVDLVIHCMVDNWYF